jgi:hypothetical protein
MRPFDCKWCAHFGPEGSTWDTRSPRLLNKEVLSCRLRAESIPTPAYTYCGNYLPEDERERLSGNQEPLGPIWVRTWDDSLPRVPYPYGAEFNDEAYRLVPVPDWPAYLAITKLNRKDALHDFFKAQIEKYRTKG